MYFRIILFIFMSVLGAQNILCQSNPLMPMTEDKERDLGVLIGLGMNFQTGDFYNYKDCKCLFSDGSKLGYSFGAFYQEEFTNSLKWGLMLLYEGKSINSSYRIKEIDTVTSQITNRSELLPLEYRYKAETDINMISILPYLDISLVDFLLTRVGFSVSTLTLSPVSSAFFIAPSNPFQKSFIIFFQSNFPKAISSNSSSISAVNGNDKISSKFFTKNSITALPRLVGRNRPSSRSTYCLIIIVEIIGA